MSYKKIMKINMIKCDVWVIKCEIRGNKLVSFLMISLKHLSSKLTILYEAISIIVIIKLSQIVLLEDI